MKIACIGEAMIELSFRGSIPSLGVAGDTLNTAIYLKRAAPKLQVDYVTRLGTDPFSAQIKTFIAAQNIGIEAIETSQKRHPGLYAISTSASGERAFTYWRAQSAARELFQTANGADFSALNGYDALYLSGITLAILPSDIRHELLNFLKTSDALFAFDSNYRSALWSDAQEARRTINSFWEISDLALPSLDDEMELFQENFETVQKRFAAYGSLGALKRGEKGPLSLGEPVSATRYPTSPIVVDTTAAGDSFNGAYLGAKLSGENQERALQKGHACAAQVVQVHGAIIEA